MRRCAAVLVLSTIAAGADAGEANLSVIVGGQLLEQKNTELSHGPLYDEVTLGRTLLGGLSLGLRLGDRHHLAIEGVIGPFHDDIDRACIVGGMHLECTIAPFVATSFAVHYSTQYSYVFGSGGTRPFVGIGIGGKHYDYDESLYTGLSSDSLTSHATVGLELGSRVPFRLESRFVIVWNNPYLWYLEEGYGTSGPRQYELQLRASVGFPLSR